MNGDNEVGALRSGMTDSPVLCFESTLTARWIRSSFVKSPTAFTNSVACPEAYE